MQPGTRSAKSGALERQFDNFKAMSFRVEVRKSRIRGRRRSLCESRSPRGQVLDIAAEGFVDAQLGVREQLDQA